MKAYGIHLEKVSSFSTQEKYIRKFIEQNNLKTNGEVDIYNQPDQNSTIIARSQIDGSSNYSYNNFYFIRSLGWVKQEDVSKSRNKVSWILKIVYQLNLLKAYVFLKGLFKQNETNNFVLVFKRTNN